MKKQFTSLVLSCLLSLSLFPTLTQGQELLTSDSLSTSVSTLFPDVPQEEWYTKYIQVAYDAGCIKGKDNGYFEPEATVTFAEWAVMISNAYHGPTLTEEKNKITTEHWGAPYVNTLKESYLFNQDFTHLLETYLYDESLSRYQASYLTAMLLHEKNVASEEDSFYTSQLHTYIDTTTCENPVLLGTTVYHDIMSGKTDDTFHGDGTLTRGEACVILTKLLSHEDITREQYKTPTSYTFRYSSYLLEHYEKHGIDMGFPNQEAYLAAANDVVSSYLALWKLEEDGDDCYFIEATNEFVVVSPDEYIRTYFIATGGLDYFNRQ